ncbi:LysR family transcriptional regulator [Diaphorobacter sp.]|uniref:LysR family transcriptional regulator n=1 Tax=Diaphorobacter sp. TaxID=1934310 RepID=UPI0028AFF6A8|nr:LysR family transcriptional regulator [Diaphorobacter sp.]
MTFGIDLRDLTYFEKIAELEHVGAAAEKLHRTQPALTASIRRLEVACGAQLFERNGRGIRLTSEGVVLLSWARRIRLDVQDAQREMKELGGGVAGHVRLGVVPTAAQFLLPQALQKLMHEVPGVTVKASVGLGKELRERVQAGELDLAIVSGHRTESAFEVVPLLEDQIVVVAARTHPLVKMGRKVKLDELNAYEWVLQPPDSPTREWLDHTFDRARLPRPRVRMESDMLMMLPALLHQTDVLGFVSRLHFSRLDRNTILREIPLPQLTMRRQLIAIWRKSSHFPAAGKLLVKYLKQANLATR